MLRALIAAIALLGAAPALAQNADLQITSYAWTPDPTPNGGAATFTIQADNTGPGAADGAVVTIQVSAAFEVANQPGTAFPAFCTLAGAFPRRR